MPQRNPPIMSASPKVPFPHHNRTARGTFKCGQNGGHAWSPLKQEMVFKNLVHFCFRSAFHFASSGYPIIVEHGAPKVSKSSSHFLQNSTPKGNNASVLGTEVLSRRNTHFLRKLVFCRGETAGPRSRVLNNNICIDIISFNFKDHWKYSYIPPTGTLTSALSMKLND